MLQTLPSDLIGYLATFLDISTVESTLRLLDRRFNQVLGQEHVRRMRQPNTLITKGVPQSKIIDRLALYKQCVTDIRILFPECSDVDEFTYSQIVDLVKHFTPIKSVDVVCCTGCSQNYMSGLEQFFHNVLGIQLNFISL